MLKYLKITWRFRKSDMELQKFRKWIWLVRNFSIWIWLLRNSFSAWCSRLQMAITSSFQLWFAHYLKHWSPDFPSFKIIYSMYTMNSIKCSKFVIQLLSFWISHSHAKLLHVGFLSLFFFFASLDWLGNLLPRVVQNSSSFLACFDDQKATKNTKTSQKLISNTCKGP